MLYFFVRFQPVPIYNVVFIQTDGCPMLTWKADKHGLCDVDLLLEFIQKDGSMKNVTVPVADRIYQHCNLTMNAVSVFYKTLVYLRTKTTGKRIQTNDAEPQSFQTSLVITTTTTTTTTSTTPTTTTTTTPTTPKTTTTTPKTTTSTTTPITSTLTQTTTTTTTNVNNNNNQKQQQQHQHQQQLLQQHQ